MKSTVTRHDHHPLRAVFGATVLAILFGLGLGSTALAGNENNNPKVFKQGSMPYNKSYGEWAARFQQWLLGIPTATNPLFDETGAFASIGQSGPVWFLSGNLGGESVRTVTVPHGKALFFPLVSILYFRAAPEEPSDRASILDAFSGFLAGAEHSCEIDGVSVNNVESYYTESPLFNQILGPDNLFGLDPGVYSPAMDFGYFLMVKPLKKGLHTIHIGGGLPAIGFETDMTYNIIVQ